MQIDTKIKTLKITDIKPYWRNPRNNAAAIEAVKQSITQFGFNQPLILDEDNVIIAGHTRYKALQELGATSIPCIIKAGLSAQEAKQYRIADNKTSELSKWDMEKLIPELREIEAIEDMQIYFPAMSLDDLLQESAGGKETFKLPTTEQIGKVEAKLQAKFEDGSKAQQSAYVEVVCPHCAESFHVDRNEIARER
ncbi:Spo0J Stage 0 sporulation protein J (antagonist of Soj) containing ParB-like nuclease domain [uncultured Caudovirales phage]|uniref:Spo0J Stage 0 sporulation protein J (Antagonist of Soj) containing ParB-like nuclease domain n=1 Tax=uncultured Caudovirales phage TaxID=2100421 RepID=A0A6J5S232_9CAUD|nr:Spo0J Stage 0 sporulation protein J (antagonist of Soj) containing ParB-like nuclease domain [uncultured Caudovirales phage]CAB4200629.1 Spo0J Stage 0 sporulation protein J (antagonist of Soj) containing ParB-like nuclease domain [uncultured Caudovirales phage]